MDFPAHIQLQNELASWIERYLLHIYGKKSLEDHIKPLLIKYDGFVNTFSWRAL
jgi:hypothetical protein